MDVNSEIKFGIHYIAIIMWTALSILRRLNKKITKTKERKKKGVTKKEKKSRNKVIDILGINTVPF